MVINTSSGLDYSNSLSGTTSGQPCKCDGSQHASPASPNQAQDLLCTALLCLALHNQHGVVCVHYDTFLDVQDKATGTTPVFSPARLAVDWRSRHALQHLKVTEAWGNLNLVEWLQSIGDTAPLFRPFGTAPECLLL